MHQKSVNAEFLIQTHFYQGIKIEVGLTEIEIEIGLTGTEIEHLVFQLVADQRNNEINLLVTT